MLIMVDGTKKGLTLRGPLAIRAAIFCSIKPRPPIPEPTAQPTRGAFSGVILSPESSKAIKPAAIPYWINISILRASFLVISNCSGSKPLTRPAILLGKSVVSKCSILQIPLLPASRFFHDSSAVLPTGDSMPRPVTTTLRFDTGLPPLNYR